MIVGVYKSGELASSADAVKAYLKSHNETLDQALRSLGMPSLRKMPKSFRRAVRENSEPKSPVKFFSPSPRVKEKTEMATSKLPAYRSQKVAETVTFQAPYNGSDLLRLESVLSDPKKSYHISWQAHKESPGKFYTGGAHIDTLNSYSQILDVRNKPVVKLLDVYRLEITPL